MRLVKYWIRVPACGLAVSQFLEIFRTSLNVDLSKLIKGDLSLRMDQKASRSTFQLM